MALLIKHIQSSTSDLEEIELKTPKLIQNF